MRSICTGADGFTFQKANSNTLEGSAFGILWRNGANYLRVDGHCMFYVFGAYRNDPILTGTLSDSEAEALARDTRYDTWPELDGLDGKGYIADAAIQVLNDGQHELLCRGGCADYPWTERPEQVEIGAIFKPMLDATEVWRKRLSSMGTPIVEGNVRFAVAIQGKQLHAGGFLEWPLSVPIERYAVDPGITFEDENYAPITTGFLAEGADAVALRELRAEAVRTAFKGSQTEGWIAIDGPGDTFYEVVVGDVLPYEDENGVVPRFWYTDAVQP